MIAKKKENVLQYQQCTLHLRYGIIVTDNKHCRFVIARVDTINHPLVFLREWDDDTEEGYDVYYTLYKSALTADEADEILLLLKNDEKRKANTLLKRYFRPEGVLCEFVGETRLDDAVPDEWYDVWKKIDGPITFRRDHPGYDELDVEQILW